MPSIRLTLVNNAKQTQKSAVILKVEEASDPLTDILTLAKNKLRLKKAKTLYLNHGIELADPSWLKNGKVAQDSLIYVSCGEGYVGQTRQEPSPATGVAVSATPSATKEGDDTTTTTSTDENKNNTASTTTDLDFDSLLINSEVSATISILAKKSFVDPEANAQLNRTAMLPGMRKVVGQPDLHPGNQYPIGVTFITQKFIYPALIGNDIGCGMAVYRTRLSSGIKPQKIVDKLHGLEGRWTEGDPHAFLISQLGEEHTETGKAHLDQLGTLGGGNHFAEFVTIESRLDLDLCDSIGLTGANTYLIVHSGSRKFGQTVLEASNSMQTKAEKKLMGIDAESEVGQAYLKQHDLACAWARTNRELIAHRVLTRLNAEQDATKILDIWHNNVEQKTIESIDSQRPCWIHRKGAAPSDRGLVVIPGSRGHFSYLVMPHGDQDKNGFSLAHGAGRLLPRAKALQKRPQTSKQASISALQTTDLGSSVICEDTDLLFEEQPGAYKEITDIIDDLGPFVKVVAILRPICTYKMRKESRT
ncbi:release factor H-coupled R [Linnemannia elongata]|nr:release factor H-coupled R [Linnemannia elongata]